MSPNKPQQSSPLFDDAPTQAHEPPAVAVAEVDVPHVDIDKVEARLARGMGMDETPGLVPMSKATTSQAIELAKQRIMDRIEAQKTLKLAALSFTTHRDWIFHQGPDGERIPYLMDQGTEKLMHAFGIDMDVLDTQVVVHEDTGTFEVVVFGKVRATVFSPIWYPIVGSRWSGDGFFDKGIRTDPGDVRKSGYTSFYNRGVKKVLGLRGLTEEDLEKIPTIDTKRIPTVTMREGGAKSITIAEVLGQKHIACSIPYENETARNIFKKLKGARFHKETHPTAERPKLWICPYSDTAEKQCGDLVAMDAKIGWRVMEPVTGTTAEG